MSDMESRSPTREGFRSFSIKRQMAALRRNRSSDTFDVNFLDHQENDRDPSHIQISNSTLLSVFEIVDRFLERTSCDGYADRIDDVQVQNSVEELCRMAESMVERYSNHVDALVRGLSSKFGHNQQDDKNFYLALPRIYKLSFIFCNSNRHNHNVSNTALMNRTTSVLHKAMCFLDTELHQLLQNPNKSNVVSSYHHTKSSNKKGGKILASFNSIEESTDRSIIPDQDSSAAAPWAQEDQDDQRFPPFSQEAISNMNKIAAAMVKGGYELECCMIFTSLRKTAFKAELQKMGFEIISIDDAQRTQWVSLEADIATWTNIVRHCSAFLFSGERELCESVFANQPDISKSIFSDVASAVISLLLNFAEAIALTTGSGEKLFKILDMYETLGLLEQAIVDMFPEECVQELKREVMDVKLQLGEASVCMFCDLENSIERDHGKVPVPSGAVHPLIRYVMNYLKYSCEYNDTLEEVFQQHSGKWKSSPNEIPETAESERKADETPRKSAFGEQLIKVMDLLDENLENKASLYRNPALRYIFLMNNGRYMLQKVKGSKEIHEAVGDNWCRRRSTVVRQYHKKYQRETWGKVLECLRHEGLQEKGKVLKPVLKERFKSFNATMDEIQKTQSTWVVSDEQLKSELRVSISSVVIPAYRSFLGRFTQYLHPGKQTHKYIKYQHEDLENLVEQLFDGNSHSMAKRRT